MKISFAVALLATHAAAQYDEFFNKNGRFLRNRLRKAKEAEEEEVIELNRLLPDTEQIKLGAGPSNGGPQAGLDMTECTTLNGNTDSPYYEYAWDTDGCFCKF